MSLAAAALAGLIASGAVSADVTSSNGLNKTSYAVAGQSAYGLSDHDKGKEQCKGKEDCKGKDECKGKDGCKGDANDCKGKTECKGHEGHGGK